MFQHSTFAELCDKNYNDLLAEGIDKNISYRHIDICFNFCFFFSALSATKAALKKKNLIDKTVFVLPLPPLE